MSCVCALPPQSHGLPAAFLRAVHQGLVPPHIAAGINLNFWPAGRFSAVWGRSLFAVRLKAITLFHRFP